MAKKKFEAGTKIEFIGGVNDDRIGGNCSVIEHTNESGKVTRVMYDMGAMFAPYESGFEAAYPNLEDYFDRVNPVSGEVTKAKKPVDALFITHAHEDHIGALVSYVRMGYQLPPIKTSRFTKNLINIVFTQNGLKAPEMEKVKPGANIRIGDDVVVEPFVVSHSILEPIGFHTLTFVNDKPHAGIMNFGDFLTEENMPLGASYNKDDIEDLLKRKLTTTFLIDSTSITPKSTKRIGFDKAVENTVDVINRNPDRHTIISPVISRSFQNIAIDIEAARKLGTKVCLEGAWLNLVYRAMQISGYDDFDDVIYKGRLNKFLEDKKISKKYIVCTGAFAQGLQEYRQNRETGGLNNIPMAAATKMALGLHKDMKITSDCLVPARQRIIDEINGKTGPEMLQLFASQGAKVVVTPSGKKIANFEEVQMQDSGHLNGDAFRAMLAANQKLAPEAVYIPIHGNPEQCQNTADIVREAGGQAVMALNSDVIAVSLGKAEPVVSDKPKDYNWIALKRVFYNPLKPEEFVPAEGKLEFWLVDKNYQPLQDKPILDTSLIKKSNPGDEDYYANHAELFDDTAELERKETNRQRKVKMSRKEKKEFRDEEKAARLKKKADIHKRNTRREADIMSYVDGLGAEHVKTTKSGKPRKINPLKKNGFSRD